MRNLGGCEGPNIDRSAGRNEKANPSQLKKDIVNIPGGWARTIDGGRKQACS